LTLAESDALNAMREGWEVRLAFAASPSSAECHENCMRRYKGSCIGYSSARHRDAGRCIRISTGLASDGADLRAMTGGAGYAQRHLEHSDYYDEAVAFKVSGMDAGGVAWPAWRGDAGAI